MLLTQNYNLNFPFLSLLNRLQNEIENQLQTENEIGYRSIQELISYREGHHAWN